MLCLIALAYLLLCVRIHVQLEAALEDGQGGAALCVGALGVNLRREYAIAGEWKPPFLRVLPRHGKRKQQTQKGRVSGAATRLMRFVLLDALRSGRVERLSLQLCLGDACETAVAAGAARAIACSILTAAGSPKPCDLRVTPDFSGTHPHARATGIFSFQPGDIMLAALKQARRKRARD